jgi:hypothetical protein
VLSPHIAGWDSPHGPFHHRRAVMTSAPADSTKYA